MRVLLVVALLACSVTAISMAKKNANKGDDDDDTAGYIPGIDENEMTAIKESISQLDSKVVNLVNALKTSLAEEVQNINTKIAALSLDTDNKWAKLNKQVTEQQNKNVIAMTAISSAQANQISDLRKGGEELKALISGVKNTMLTLPLKAKGLGKQLPDPAAYPAKIGGVSLDQAIADSTGTAPAPETSPII